MTDYSDQIKETKKGYSLTTDETANENINITDFVPEKKKKITVNLNNSGANNVYRSSYFDETINVKNGDYTMLLYGNSSKTVNLGSTSMTSVQLLNNGKNKVTAGDGGNSFSFQNINAQNTVIAGKGDDSYIIQKGTNKITDKGGDNTFNISSEYSNNTIISGTGKDTYTIGSHGVNNITDKGGDNTFTVSGVHCYGKFVTGSGEDKFDITVSSMDGNLTINSGAGTDKLYIHNIADNSNVTRITADLGNDNDTVKVDYGTTGNKDVTFTNIKTGKGNDTVAISAGIENIIDTGKDGDNITIDGGRNNYITSGDGADAVIISAGLNNKISTGNDADTITVMSSAVTSTTTIKAGKGNDKIEINGGTNTVYGEAGKDEVKLKGGTNTVYGGTDTIIVTNGGNTIFANADTITVSDGINVINATNGKNTIEVNGGNSNTINLSKGNNTVNVSGGTSENYIKATVNISAGKNTVNIGGYSLGTINSTAKTTQTLDIKENAFCGAHLGTGNDIIYTSSIVEETNTIYAGGGNDKIYISAGKKRFEGEAGNDYFELSGGSGHSIDGGDGNDTIDIKEGVTTDKINSIEGGQGKDTFNIEGGKSTIEANEGNDIINLKNGTENTIYGNAGADTFNISGGNENNIHGDTEGDIFNITGGENNSIYGDDGKDNFIVSGGTSNNIYGGETNDIFTINGGYLNHYYGGNGSDTFNIKGGKFTYIDGDIGTETGDDIYNLNTKSEDSFVLVNDSSGNNTINVSKGYKGASSFSSTGSAKFSLNFDKSYKLTNGSNVKSDVVKTTDSNITIYGKFVYNNTTPADSYFDEGWGYQFIVNAQNEIKDNEINNRFINGTFNSLSSVKIGGLDYTLNLDQLKSDLVAWFSTRDYADSNAVFTGGDEADINSLMAVYTKDTADCFIKA